MKCEDNDACHTFSVHDFSFEVGWSQRIWLEVGAMIPLHLLVAQDVS